MVEEIKANSGGRRVIIPTQYVGKWTNENQVHLRVLQVLDIDTRELVKCFVPTDDFQKFNLKQATKESGKNLYVFSFITDSEDRENLLSVELVGTYEINVLNKTFSFSFDEKKKK